MTASQIRQLNFRLIQAAAKWMDRTYPLWATGVRDAVRQSRFNIKYPSMCVIGAGTGHSWTPAEQATIERSVARSLKLPVADVDGIVADVAFEHRWIAEAFQRGRFERPNA